MKKRFLSPLSLAISSLLASSACLTVYADSLPSVNITATRTSQTIDQSLASVTIITQEEIKRSTFANVAELLTHKAGISVSRSGGSDHLTAIRIRGSESRHVLVLVDGIRIGSVTSGAAQLQLISLNQIERIEIVRGARSSLYGSEALGGVIQVFTRKGRKTPEASISFAVGSHNRRQTQVNISGQVGDMSYAGSLEDDRTQGYDICNNDAGNIFAACFVNEADNDGSTRLAGNLKLDYALNKDTHLSTTYNRTNSHLEYDGSNFSGNVSRGYIETLGFKLDTHLSDDWDLSFVAGRSRDATDTFFNGAQVNFFDTTRMNYSLQNTIYVTDDHSITVGIDYIDDTLASNTNYTLTERSNVGYFFQYQGSFDQLDISTSFRHDNNEQFGTANTGSIALGADLTDNARVHTAYSTAFSAPSFNFLYHPFGSNPNLLPETSKNIEVGLSGNTNNIEWSASLFHKRIDDLIINDGAFIPQNISQAVIRGLELTFNTRISDWHINADITLLDPRIKNDTTTPTNNNNLLARRAKRSANITLDREFGAWAMSANIQYQSDSFDRSLNTRRLDGFTLLNLGSSYQVNKNWVIKGHINNLLDSHYETEFYYPQDGRTFMLTAQWDM